jgi:hypothetical protein
MVTVSDYNARRRPSEVLFDNGEFIVVRSQETYKYLLSDDKIDKS